jgi:hypothetical protein
MVARWVKVKTEFLDLQEEAEGASYAMPSLSPSQQKTTSDSYSSTSSSYFLASEAMRPEGAESEPVEPSEDHLPMLHSPQDRGQKPEVEMPGQVQEKLQKGSFHQLEIQVLEEGIVGWNMQWFFGMLANWADARTCKSPGPGSLNSLLVIL